jgi:hypothetical protein
MNTVSGKSMEPFDQEAFRSVRMRNRIVIASIVLFLFALLAYGWLNLAAEDHEIFSDNKGRAAGVESHSQMARSSGSDTHPDITAAETSAPQDREIDFSTPLRLQVKRLSAAADRGDANAVCKLIKSFEYCKNIVEMESARESFLVAAAEHQQNNGESVNDLDEIIKYENDIQKAYDFCTDLAGVSVESELTRRLLQAAEAGDIGAMQMFVFDPPLSAEAPLSVADAMVLYSKKAPEILKEMAFLGDVQAIEALYEAHSRGFFAKDFGDVPVDRDPEILAAAADVLVEFGESYVQKDVSDRLASGTIKSAASTSRRSAQLRERMRKSVMGMANAKSPAALRDDRPIPACS